MWRCGWEECVSSGEPTRFYKFSHSTLYSVHSIISQAAKHHFRHLTARQPSKSIKSRYLPLPTLYPSESQAQTYLKLRLFPLHLRATPSHPSFLLPCPAMPQT